MHRLKINIMTIFPDMFIGFLNESIIKRAIADGYLEINLVNIRDYAYNKHNNTDDYPFGGGAGMVFKPEPLFEALEQFRATKIIYTTPQGNVFNQSYANSLAAESEITIIAGHYEGIDERVVDEFVDLELSIGDYVLTGGEIPAMVIADAVARLIPGVIGNSASFAEDSFYNGLLDYPHYTRPAEYNGLKVPEILLGGHHENIRKWRLKESLKRTYLRRPDLLEGREFTKEERKIMQEIMKELNIEK